MPSLLVFLLTAYLFAYPSQGVSAQSITPSATVTPNAATDAEKAKLEGRIAEYQKNSKKPDSRRIRLLTNLSISTRKRT